MIYTLTLNPAIDMTMHIASALKTGKVNRSIKDDISIGGKGINIATVLNNLGEDVTPIVVVAGYTGQLVSNYIKDTFRRYHIIDIQNGLTRLKVNVIDEKETQFNGNGPIILDQDVNRITDIVKDIEDDDYLCISGSVPSNLDNHIYATIISCLNNNPRIIIDSDKELLFNTLKYRPFLIKPNLDELQSYFNVKITDKEEIKKYMTKLQDLGARNILCSLGEDGAMLLDENNSYHYLDTIKEKVISTLGSGDSMIAGFISDYDRNHDYVSALKMAVACGSATAFLPSLADKDKISEIYNLLNK